MQSEITPGGIPFWMLNDAATVEERLAFLHRCHAGGISALTLHCRSGNLVPYASDEWFCMIREIVEEGARLGMQIWLYDEDPYPSGAAGGMVMAERSELRARAMTRLEVPAVLRPGQLWLISPHRVLWAGLEPTRAGLPPKALTGDVGTLRTDWFMTDWDSRHYYDETPLWPCARGDAKRQQYAMRVPELPDGYQLIAIIEQPVDEEGSWGGLPDLLHPETFDSFCRLSLDKYSGYVGNHFGTTIPGIFTDEPKYFGWFPITDGIFEAFQTTYGYSLYDNLCRLFGEVHEELDERVRIDYRRWLALRFREMFVRPYRQWANTNNLLLVGHLSPEDDPIVEAQCLGSLMQIMIDMGVPGVDIIVPGTGTAEAPILNLGSLRAASVKAQRDAPMAISETLALTDWDVTSRKARQILTWQSVLGIDRFYFHGFFSSIDGVTIYEAPPDYGPNSPIFRGICEVNQWLATMERLTDGSTQPVHVAVLNSMLSYYTVGDFAGTERHREMRRALWQTLLALLQAHVAVHLVDEEDLADAAILHGELVVGEVSYRNLLVPALDIISESAIEVLTKASTAGLRITWFEGGPQRVVDGSTNLLPLGNLPGDVLARAVPDAAWCNGHLPVQASLSGDGAEDVYVRRFHKDGTDYLLAMNNREEACQLSIAPEGDTCWTPRQADGECQVSPTETTWQLPGQGAGILELSARPAPAPAPTLLRATGTSRSFERTGRNVLRLQEPMVVRDDDAPRHLPFPQIYSFIYDDWQAMKVTQTYAGPIPTESRAPATFLDYRFHFTSQALATIPELLLEPRCARGIVSVLLDDAMLADGLRFPLSGTTPIRVPLGQLAYGEHVLTMRFTMTSAMEGLLVQLYLEGDFAVDLEAPLPILRPDDGGDSPDGWQAAGMPHYMGDGCYRWNETLSADDLAGDLTLEIDEVVDAGELLVNGVSMGTRAWPPYRWPLTGLRPGEQNFELRVSSTAGNRLKLAYPAQAQGWLGQARLLTT